MNQRTSEAYQQHLLPAPPLTPTLASRPAALQSWQVVGAAVQGVSHARLGLPCQDVQGYQILPDGTLIVALADGAGSAPLSDQGAARAVESALAALAERLAAKKPADAKAWETLLQDIFSKARKAVLNLSVEADAAEANGAVQAPEMEEASASDPEAELAPEMAAKSAGILPERAYASTLTCAVVTTEGWLAVGQIGDGAVIAADASGNLTAVTRLQRGEYANETHFLTQPDALAHLEVDARSFAVHGLAVMSDGLIRLALKMPTQEPHAPFFAPLFRFANSLGKPGAEESGKQQLADFLNSERVNERTDDDKSLVLAVRAPAVSAAEIAPARAVVERENE